MRAPGALLQAMLQGILEGEGPVGHYLKVLKGVLLIERFVAGSSFLAPRFGRLFLGVLFLDPRFWHCGYWEPWEPWEP